MKTHTPWGAYLLAAAMALAAGSWLVVSSAQQIVNLGTIPATTPGSGGGGTSPPPTSSPSANFLSQGGQVAWVSAYNFRVSEAVYTIQGTEYTSPETSLTLSAAHMTLNRIDVITVNTSGAVVVVEGTAAATPSEPVTDPGTQLKLAIVSVPAGSSQPAEAASTTVFTENGGGAGGEWNCTDVGASFVCNATGTARTGTVHITGSGITSGDYIQHEIPSGTFDAATRNLLVFFVRSTITWATKSGLDLRFYNAGVQVGQPVVLNRSGSYGFDSSKFLAYQQVAIPLAHFQIPSGTVATQLRMRWFGGAGGMHMDDVTFQGGATIPLPDYALADLTNVKPTATPRFARLGLGGNPDATLALKVTGTIWSPLVNDGSSGTADTIDWSTGNDHISTLTGNVVYTFTNPVDGGRYVLLVQQDGTGGRTATWPGTVAWPGGTAPVITTGVNKLDLVTFIYSLTNNKYYGSFNQNY